MFQAGFGAEATVRTRRPGALFQLQLPAYLADGDGSGAVGVVITPNDLEAERAINAKHHLAKVMPSKRQKWAAINRDVRTLNKKTQLRLMQAYAFQIPKYEDEPERLVPKLRELMA